MMNTRASYRVNGRRQTKPDLLKFKPTAGRSFIPAMCLCTFIRTSFMYTYMNERLNKWYNNTECVENAGVVNRSRFMYTHSR